MPVTLGVTSASVPFSCTSWYEDVTRPGGREGIPHVPPLWPCDIWTAPLYTPLPDKGLSMMHAGGGGFASHNNH